MISSPSVKGFLHKPQMDTDIKKVKTVKVKEHNYFEHYDILSALSSELHTIKTFNDVQVG
jgi:hypothetical protein